MQESGVREHSKPTHPHQLSSPDAVPTLVCQTKDPADSQPLCFISVTGGNFSCISVVIFLCIKFHPHLYFQPTLL